MVCQDSLLQARSELDGDGDIEHSAHTTKHFDHATSRLGKRRSSTLLFCKSYQQIFFCEEYYITYAVEHQVDRAAHIQINKIDIQFLIDNFAGFDNMVHLGTADLDTKDIFRNVAFGQCPLGLLTLLHSTVSKSKRDQHCYNRHSPATSYEPWPFHRT